MGDTGYQYVRVRPNSVQEIMLQFTASSLGLANHSCKITLKSQQLGDVIYYVTGRGLAPSLMEPLSISASVGAGTSLLLPFRNPTDLPALVDIHMSDNDTTLNSIAKSMLRRKSIKSENEAFSLLQKQLTDTKLAARTSFDISFLFSPEAMRKYQANLSISIRRQDEKSWPNEFEENESDIKKRHPENEDLLRMRPMSRNKSGEITAIRWLYPVHGIPTVKSCKAGEAVLECQARSRIEERLEVSLTGAVPSHHENRSLIRLKGAAPISFKDNTLSGTKLSRGSTGKESLGAGLTLNEEYHFEFFFLTDKAKQDVEQSLTAELIKKDRDPASCLVVLVFKLVFAPFFTMNTCVQLTVTSVTGGTWTFPLVIAASEPPPDDVIAIEAVQLMKPSTVAFKLHSQAGHPTPYEAYFVESSDADFSVEPATGELLPKGTEGSQIKVSFTPKMYGCKYSALLIVKTLDMQWSYQVIGLLPKYRPPVAKSRLASGPPASLVKQSKRNRPNFMRENIELLSTASSSPVKGKPIIMSGFTTT